MFDMLSELKRDREKKTKIKSYLKVHMNSLLLVFNNLSCFLMIFKRSYFYHVTKIFAFIFGWKVK